MDGGARKRVTGGIPAQARGAGNQLLGFHTDRQLFTPHGDVTCLRVPIQPGRDVEYKLAKVGVEGSNPFARSKIALNHKVLWRAGR